MCGICGEGRTGPAVRYWSPDDGWKFGHLCKGCTEDYGSCKPHLDDYAYDQRKVYDTENVETDDDVTLLV